MRNYQTYFVLMGLCGLALLSLVFEAIVKQNPGEMIGVLIIQIPLGLMQLIAGGWLFFRKSSYPTWVQAGINNYWRYSLSYLALLMILKLAPDFHFVIWIVFLVVLPWSIAIYQVQLVCRMAALRKRQLKKRELLQLS